MTRTLLTLLLAIFIAGSPASARADQFILFDETFTLTYEEAVPSKSHLFVQADKLNPKTPTDWTNPIDYRNGSVHVIIDVLEKPPGEEPTTWSLCYIPNKGQKNGYGCTNTPLYTTEGVHEREVKMTEFWENDSIVWSEGIKLMSLVLKGKGGGKAHAHLRSDYEKFFPTKVRFLMIQVSKGSRYDASLVPDLKKKKDAN